MASQGFSMLGGALGLLEPLAQPIAWLASPSFRRRTRARWAEGGRMLRIGDVGLWLVAWSVVAVVVAVLLAAWLRGSP
jgi:hypothetical protein